MKNTYLQIVAAEMKYLTFVPEYTHLDMKCNDDVHIELQIFSLADKIDNYRKK